MKKIILFCSMAAITSVIYWACRKEQTPNAVKENTNDAGIMAKVQQNEFTVEEFEIELTSKLNMTAIKMESTDKTYNDLKSIHTTVADLKVEIQNDGTAHVKRAELEKAFKKIKDDINNAAKINFPPASARVLAYLLDEEISIPPSTPGEIKEVILKIVGLIGNAVQTPPPCEFDNTMNNGTGEYLWEYTNPYPVTMLNDLMARLNDPACNPYLSICPEYKPHEQSNTFIVTSFALGICNPATPFECMAWIDPNCDDGGKWAGIGTPYICQNCTLPYGVTFYPEDLNTLVNNIQDASIFLLEAYPQKVPYCTFCPGEIRQSPYKYELFGTNTFEGGCLAIYITYYYSCCRSTCPGKSIINHID